MKQGDIIKVSFDPKIGHEQAGYRPACIISNDFAIGKTSVVLVCPITNTDNGFPTHIPLDARTETTGFVLCEHVRAIDLSNRSHRFVERLPEDILQRVVDVVSSLIEI
ncbi:MAG: type II toxin-antitoxin system PemK/MazF family toxin [Oscillospiraceae bacterium]|nr:type II toxin-antitoxin system PemK/MazF family toxin [Oscillospiraceae bacterium]